MGQVGPAEPNESEFLQPNRLDWALKPTDLQSDDFRLKVLVSLLHRHGSGLGIAEGMDFNDDYDKKLLEVLEALRVLKGWAWEDLGFKNYRTFHVRLSTTMTPLEAKGLIASNQDVIGDLKVRIGIDSSNQIARAIYQKMGESPQKVFAVHTALHTQSLGRELTDLEMESIKAAVLEERGSGLETRWKNWLQDAIRDRDGEDLKEDLFEKAKTFLSDKKNKGNFENSFYRLVDFTQNRKRTSDEIHSSIINLLALEATRSFFFKPDGSRKKNKSKGEEAFLQKEFISASISFEDIVETVLQRIKDYQKRKMKEGTPDLGGETQFYVEQSASPIVSLFRSSFGGDCTTHNLPFIPLHKNIRIFIFRNGSQEGEVVGYAAVYRNGLQPPLVISINGRTLDEARTRLIFKTIAAIYKTHNLAVPVQNPSKPTINSNEIIRGALSLRASEEVFTYRFDNGYAALASDTSLNRDPEYYRVQNIEKVHYLNVVPTMLEENFESPPNYPEPGSIKLGRDQKQFRFERALLAAGILKSDLDQYFLRKKNLPEVKNRISRTCEHLGITQVELELARRFRESGAFDRSGLSELSSLTQEIKWLDSDTVERLLDVFEKSFSDIAYKAPLKGAIRVLNALTNGVTIPGKKLENFYEIVVRRIDRERVVAMAVEAADPEWVNQTTRELYLSLPSIFEHQEWDHVSKEIERVRSKLQNLYERNRIEATSLRSRISSKMGRFVRWFRNVFKIKTSELDIPNSIEIIKISKEVSASILPLRHQRWPQKYRELFYSTLQLFSELGLVEYGGISHSWVLALEKQKDWSESMISSALKLIQSRRTPEMVRERIARSFVAQVNLRNVHLKQIQGMIGDLELPLNVRNALMISELGKIREALSSSESIQKSTTSLLEIIRHVSKSGEVRDLLLSVPQPWNLQELPHQDNQRIVRDLALDFLFDHAFKSGPMTKIVLGHLDLENFKDWTPSDWQRLTKIFQLGDIQLAEGVLRRVFVDTRKVDWDGVSAGEKIDESLIRSLNPDFLIKVCERVGDPVFLLNLKDQLAFISLVNFLEYEPAMEPFQSGYKRVVEALREARKVDPTRVEALIRGSMPIKPHGIRSEAVWHSISILKSRIKNSESIDDQPIQKHLENVEESGMGDESFKLSSILVHSREKRIDFLSRYVSSMPFDFVEAVLNSYVMSGFTLKEISGILDIAMGRGAHEEIDIHFINSIDLLLHKAFETKLFDILKEELSLVDLNCLLEMERKVVLARARGLKNGLLLKYKPSRYPKEMAVQRDVYIEYLSAFLERSIEAIGQAPWLADLQGASHALTDIFRVSSGPDQVGQISDLAEKLADLLVRVHDLETDQSGRSRNIDLRLLSVGEWPARNPQLAREYVKRFRSEWFFYFDPVMNRDEDAKENNRRNLLGFRTVPKEWWSDKQKESFLGNAKTFEKLYKLENLDSQEFYDWIGSFSDETWLKASAHLSLEHMTGRELELYLEAVSRAIRIGPLERALKMLRPFEGFEVTRLEKANGLGHRLRRWLRSNPQHEEVFAKTGFDTRAAFVFKSCHGVFAQ